MADENTDKMSPDQGLAAIMNIVQKVSEAGASGDSQALDSLIGDLGSIVEATGVDMPDIEQDLANLAGENAKIGIHAHKVDAALWVGDMERARLLIDAGVPLDHSKIAGVPSPEDIEAFDDDDFEFTDDEDYVADIDANDPDMIELIAALGLKGDQQPALPDPYAEIAKGTPGAIGQFIASGEDLNTPSGESAHTALLAALDAPGRTAEKIERLIKAGADVRVIHFQGDNALSWAMGYHHPETVTPESEVELMTLLANHGVDPHHVTPHSNWMPIHRAVIQGDAARVAGIIAAGGDITAPILPDFEPEKLAGFTPLMLAAPKPDVVRLLLEKGANPSQKDAHGRLPLDVIGGAAKAAREVATEDDPWMMDHVGALDETCTILAAAITS